MWWVVSDGMVVNCVERTFDNYVAAHNSYSFPLAGRFYKSHAGSLHLKYWRYRGFLHHCIDEWGMGYMKRSEPIGQRNYFMYFRGHNRAVLFRVPHNVRAGIEPRKSRNHVQYAVFATNIERLRGTAHSFAVAVAQGVTGTGGHFRVTLELRGLGYKIYVPEPKRLEFKLGFSHLAVFRFKGTCFAKALGLKYRNFVIFAKELVEVTAVAARIRNLRKINVYKGKGIFKKYFKYKKKESKRK